MMNERHQPKHFAEALKVTCNYCHHSPALWHYAGSEKICVHCGTRVFHSVASTPSNLLAKSANR